MVRKREGERGRGRERRVEMSYCFILGQLTHC